MSEHSNKRYELIQTAKSFFYSVGYSKTSVQNIIDSAGVAKGTFYHYFKSKEDLLNQFVDSEVSALYLKIETILEMDINAIEKFNILFRSATGWKSENVNAMKQLMKVMISDDNLMLRHTMLRHQIKQIAPIYEKIIAQGKKEGVFDVLSPKYTASYLLNSYFSFTDEIYELFAASDYSIELFEQFRRILSYFEDTIERLLGTKRGSIQIIDEVVLERLIKGLLEA